MSLKVLLILLSFATISQCRDVCLCCDEQVVGQNLTDCRDIGRQATQGESNFLLQFCNKWSGSRNYMPHRIATIQQFDSNSVQVVDFPMGDCNEIFHSMDGLLYLLPESDSALFKKLFETQGCYVAVLKNSSLHEEAVPGLVCISGYGDERTSTFRPFESGHQVEISNPTRYIYFIRRPVSYKITKVSYIGNDVFSGISNYHEDLGKFSTCMKHNIDANSTISVKYKTETTLNFKPFSRLYDQLMSNGYSIISKPITIELTDVENKTRIVGYPKFDQTIHYRTDREYTTPLKRSIRHQECLSGTVEGRWETIVKKANVTFEINLGYIGSFKDHVVVNKQVTVRESGITNVAVYETQLFGYYDHYDAVIIIPYTTVTLFLGCVLGMVIFGLVLLIAIKCGSCCDKMDFKKDWERTTERLNNSWVIVSTVTQEKAGIIGHRLVRLGDYICNVGTWIYEEIDTSLSSYQNTINRSEMEDEENNPRE